MLTNDTTCSSATLPLLWSNYALFSRLLHSERGEVPDVPAIYFCQATEENLMRIAQDFSAGLYSSYYLNFSSPITRQRMEDLAQSAVESGVQADIKKVIFLWNT